MFQGSSVLSLDSKGRLSIPTRHRDALHSLCGGQLTLTRQPTVLPQSELDKCLLLYPRPVWDEKSKEISRFPAQAVHWKRFLLGRARKVELDGSGRIQIPSELRVEVDLTSEVVLLGMGSYFEIWDAAELKRREEEDMKKGIPEGLEHFSF